MKYNFTWSSFSPKFLVLIYGFLISGAWDWLYHTLQFLEFYYWSPKELVPFKCFCFNYSPYLSLVSLFSFWKCSKVIFFFKSISQIYWDVIDIQLYNFNIYNVKILYMYILQNDYHNKVANTSITSHNYNFLCVWSGFNLFSWQLSKMHYSIINYSCHVVHYSPRPYSFNNWKFISFNSLHQFCINLPSLETTSLFWFFFFFLLTHIYFFCFCIVAMSFGFPRWR